MLKKTAEFSVVFRDKKREESFIEQHKIGTKSFTRERKLGFDKMMTMIIKKSNKSIQNSLNDMQLDLGHAVSISNSAYTQARAKLNYTAFQEYATMSADMFYSDGEYETYQNFRILAIDGSVVTLPNSKDISSEFNPMNVRCQIEGFKKEVRFTMLYFDIVTILLRFIMFYYALLRYCYALLRMFSNLNIIKRKKYGD